MALRFGAALAGLLALAGPAHPRTPSHPPPSAASFDEVAARAETAREGGRLGEARVLSRAYARAGRTAEAERASARFQELEAARRAGGGPTSAPAEGLPSEPQ